MEIGGGAFWDIACRPRPGRADAGLECGAGYWASARVRAGLAQVLRREDALERDAEVEGQVRLQVVVRLVAAGRRERVSD